MSSWFHSPLRLALLALALVLGLGHQLVDQVRAHHGQEATSCCSSAGQSHLQAENADAHHPEGSSQTPHESHHHGLCCGHQGLTAVADLPLAIHTAWAGRTAQLFSAEVTPPDAPARGIDYPPQLA